jgi:hypothetical protein
MKARILPLGDIAEFGKTDSAVLSIVITPHEAGVILETLADPTGLESEPIPVQLLLGYLRVIAGGDVGTVEEQQDAVNTDGRSLRRRAHVIDPVNVMIQGGSISTVGHVSPSVMARRVAEEMGTHVQRCNCEYHRLARGGR